MFHISLFLFYVVFVEHWILRHQEESMFETKVRQDSPRWNLRERLLDSTENKRQRPQIGKEISFPWNLLRTNQIKEEKIKPWERERDRQHVERKENQLIKDCWRSRSRGEGKRPEERSLSHNLLIAFLFPNGLFLFFFISFFIFIFFLLISHLGSSRPHRISISWIRCVRNCEMNENEVHRRILCFVFLFH